MTFKFHEASCVIVGTFNIYIIRPDWLGKIGVLPEGSQVKIESQLDQPGFRFSSPNLGARWTVLPNRLILETDNPDEDCGETADRILECLPWTPLMGLGCNVAYRGDASAVDAWEEKTAFPPTQLPDACELNQRTWYVGVKRGEQLFNLQMSELEDCIEVRANVHTELRNRDIESIRETARQFLQHRQSSLSLVRDIFKARIEDATNNE